MVFRLGCVIPSITDGTSFYRAGGPLQALALDHPDVVQLETGGVINWVYLRGVHGVFMQRPYNNDHMKVMAISKLQGKPVWIDYDDDLYSVPLQNPTHAIYSPKAVNNNITSLVANADIVSVSSEALQVKLQKILERIAASPENREISPRYFNPEKVVVVPNAYDEKLLNYSWKKWNDPLPAANLCALWRGSHTHDADLSAYTIPIAQAFLRDGFNWTMNFVGSPWWGAMKHFAETGIPDEKIVHTKALDPIEYLKFLHVVSPAFIFVPLLDDTFNRGKSNIAWIESTHAGAMTLAPDWEEWRRPGIINYRNQDDFRTKFSALLKGSYDRQKLVRESRDFIAENLTLSVVNRKREQIIERLKAID